MTVIAAPIARPYKERNFSNDASRRIMRMDAVLLALVVFAASGAVYRYGGVNTYLWYGIYAWTAARLSLELPTLASICIRNWPIFLWPALALASIAWSPAPEASLRGGLQLLMTTLIAVFLGSRFQIRDILLVLIFVLSGAAFVSLFLLLTGGANLFAEAGGFQGVFAHKNTMGLRMNILVAAALTLLMTTRWKIPLLAILVLAIYLLVLSKSATSQILALATPAVIFAMVVSRTQLRGALLGFTAGGAFLAGMAVLVFIANGDPVSFVLDSFDKDTTLTGRTWLWAQGMEQIAKHPLIGGGYQAFWAFERSSDVVWIRHNTLETVKGFHNVGVEVWNDLGAPGFVSLIGVVICYAIRSLKRYLRMPAIDNIFPLFFTLIIVISASVNNSFFRQHELVHILICAFFAATIIRRNSPAHQTTGECAYASTT